jgi:hypothetical protein
MALLMRDVMARTLVSVVSVVGTCITTWYNTILTSYDCWNDTLQNDSLSVVIDYVRATSLETSHHKPQHVLIHDNTDAACLVTCSLLLSASSPSSLIAAVMSLIKPAGTTHKNSM